LISFLPPEPAPSHSRRKFDANPLAGPGREIGVRLNWWSHALSAYGALESRADVSLVPRSSYRFFQVNCSLTEGDTGAGEESFKKTFSNWGRIDLPFFVGNFVPNFVGLWAVPEV